MHNTVQNLIYIEGLIKSSVNDLNNNNLPKIIAVSKTFSSDKILPFIEHGHIDFGENKVQEAIDMCDFATGLSRQQQQQFQDCRKQTKLN